MHSLLKSRKAQFYIISVVGIITILYATGRSLTESSIVDTSEVALTNDFFIFNNIVEKTLTTLSMVRSCEDLSFYLEEFKFFVIREYAPKYKVEYSYAISSCNDNLKSATVSFNITLSSLKSQITTSFTKNVNW